MVLYQHFFNKRNAVKVNVKHKKLIISKIQKNIMKQQKNNSKLIFALSMLWGFSLISLQFVYYLGTTTGLANAMDRMIQYTPIAIAILMCSWIAGRSLNKMQFNINLTKRKFILIAILCLFFFPIGLFFLFGTTKYKKLEA